MPDAAEARLLRMQNGWREEERREAKLEADAAEADLVQWKSEFERLDRLSRTGGGVSVTRSEWEIARRGPGPNAEAV